MPYQNISFETEGQIAIVTLNRPQRRNALSLELMTELIGCLSEIGRDRFPARGDSDRRGKSLLLRPRPQRDGWPRHQRLPRGLERLHRADDAHPVHSAAGNRAGARHCYGCWLPTGGDLRYGRCLRPGGVRDSRSQDRPVLYHTDGRPEPRRRPQARLADADDRRHGERFSPRSSGDSSTWLFRLPNWEKGEQQAGGAHGRSGLRLQLRWASRRFIPKSILTNPRLTPTRRK